MSFSDILGHERQIAVIKRGIEAKRIPPAYLLHGAEGLGKRMVAQAFAQAVNCTGEHEPGDSCGKCHYCKNIAAGCHPNVQVVAVEINEKTDKMRQEIVIEQIREAQEFLALTSVGDGSRVLIVEDAHLMNTSTMNAFLKTLEEPPEHSHVILVTSKPNALLPTILSRCRSVSFQPLPEGLVAGFLMDRQGMSEADAHLVARMTGGRIGAALAEDAEALAGRRSEFLKLLTAIAGKGHAELLKDAEAAAKKDGALEDFVSFGTLWFRDLLVILVGGGTGLAYNRDMAAELSRWAGMTTGYRCEETLGLLRQAGRSLERTMNRRLLAEDLFFRIKEEALA
ncbi:MAG: DNA polymerase III subunit delta' [Nitrospirae bacterium]|nr:DNA polymerase III subunit delta' [Nitrospirota bacterium]